VSSFVRDSSKDLLGLFQGVGNSVPKLCVDVETMFMYIVSSANEHVMHVSEIC
jgi:hypothetical protein